MSGDFPDVYTRPSPSVVNACGDISQAGFYSAIAIGPTSAVWPTANLAIYMPFYLERPALAQKMAVQVAIQSGNCDVGIYDEKGNRLVSMGSTAVAVAGLQVFDIADTWLKPGTYFMAMCVDNITASFWRISTTSNALGRMFGLQQQAVGAVTLPNPATFAAYAQQYVPALAVAFGATI
jgi:hypothetical protein